MRLLLDTHLALWCVTGDRRLSAAARVQIEQAHGLIWVSAASVWEIAIKHPLRRRAEPLPFSAADAIGRFEEAGFQLLAISPDHAAAVETLPPLHADPFDRLLIAQARHEPMHLLTHEVTLAAYGEAIREGLKKVRSP